LAVFRTFELRNEKEELGSNKISRDDLPSCLQELGLDATPEQIQESIPTGADSKILTLEQLAIVVLNLRPIVKVDSPRSGPRVQLRSTWNADSAHSYSHQEKAAFAHHLTALFARDPHLRARLPLAPEGDDLFEGCHDGLLLCKIVNLIEPDTVDERCLNLPRKSPGSALSVYHKVENLNLALDAARAVGCQVVNIGAHDIMEGNPILVLGLVWQLIKLQLLHSITLTEHPELVLLVDAAAGGRKKGRPPERKDRLRVAPMRCLPERKECQHVVPLRYACLTGNECLHRADASLRAAAARGLPLRLRWPHVDDLKNGAARVLGGRATGRDEGMMTYMQE